MSPCAEIMFIRRKQDFLERPREKHGDRKKKDKVKRKVNIKWEWKKEENKKINERCKEDMEKAKWIQFKRERLSNESELRFYKIDGKLGRTEQGDETKERCTRKMDETVRMTRNKWDKWKEKRMNASMKERRKEMNLKSYIKNGRRSFFHFLSVCSVILKHFNQIKWK